MGKTEYDFDFDIDELLSQYSRGSDAPPPAIIEPKAVFIEDIPPKNTSKGFANNITFDNKFRGYDRDQVDDYIDKLTEDYNAICERCTSLEQENEGLRSALARLESGVIS